MKPFAGNRIQTPDPAVAELIRFFIVNFEKNRAARAALRFAQKADFPRDLVAKLEEAVRESTVAETDVETQLEEYFSRTAMQKDEGPGAIKHFNRKIPLLTALLGQKRPPARMRDESQEEY